MDLGFNCVEWRPPHTLQKHKKQLLKESYWPNLGKYEHKNTTGGKKTLEYILIMYRNISRKEGDLALFFIGPNAGGLLGLETHNP